MAYLDYVRAMLTASSDEIRSWTPDRQMALLLVVWRLVKRCEMGDAFYLELSGELAPETTAPEIMAMLRLTVPDSPATSAAVTEDMLSAIGNVPPLDPPLDLSSQFAVPYRRYDEMGIITSKGGRPWAKAGL